MEISELVLGCLTDIRDNGPRDPHTGICWNIVLARDARGTSFSAAEATSMLMSHWETWPLFSGHLDYPVPAPASYESPFIDIGVLEKQRARWAYVDISRGWEGEYGASRRQLLDYLIAKLSEGK